MPYSDMGVLYRFVLVILISFTSLSAHAVDYYWKDRYNDIYLSAVSACNGMAATYNAAELGKGGLTYNRAEYVSFRLSNAGQQLYYCTMSRVNINRTTGAVGSPTVSETDGTNYWRFNRIGDSCPAGSTYIAATGECKVDDQCLATKGKEVAHAQKISEIVDGHLAPLVEPPVSVCSGSCLYSNAAATSDGYRFVSGNPTGVWQNYSYIGTGGNCTAGTAAPEPTALPERNPTSSKSNECTNKSTDAEGRVHYSCLATDSFTEPGNMSCGMANGQMVCTNKKPSPAKKDKKVETEVTETSNADGSKTTDTKTTTTVTNCNGANSCTSTTSVSNNTSKTNADGSDGGSSSSCTGPGCKDGSAEADGKEEEGEEEAEDEVAGESCGQPLTCSGDVIQCAILKQEKESKCQWDYDQAKAGIESEVAKEEYQVKEGEHDVGGLFSSAIGAARWLPASCPPPEHYSLRSGNGVSGQFSWEPTCDLARGLAPVIVGSACLFFAVFVGRGIGGGA